jgi:membrane associated rhomboid family serine protease
MSEHDINLTSFKDNKLLMGMISIWPECKDNRLQLWRLISGIFIHADLGHIISNILALLPLSFLLELNQHFYSITPLFIAGIIHSSLAFYYTNPYSYALGASGGVFTLIGLNIANLLLNSYNYNKIYTFFVFMLCSLMIISDIYTYDETNNIAYISHWTGLLSGFIGGTSFLKIYTKSRFKTYISYTVGHLYFLFTVVMFYNYIINFPPLQSYNYTLEPIDTINCCYEWFKYKNNNPTEIFENYSCPYVVTYKDEISFII